MYKMTLSMSETNLSPVLMTEGNLFKSKI